MAEMGVVGRWKCNGWRKGCGGIDATAQPHVRLEKSVPREVRGDGLSNNTGTSICSDPPPKIGQVGQSTGLRLALSFCLFYSRKFTQYQVYTISTQSVTEGVAKC